MQERHAQMPMARWMLEFDQREVERDFVAYDDAAGVQQGRFAIGIGLVFTFFYSLIDLVRRRGRPARRDPSGTASCSRSSW